jgi:hypothetical protein
MKKAVIYIEGWRYKRHRENLIADMSEAVLQIHYDCGAPMEEIDALRPSLQKAIGRWWDSHNTYHDDHTKWGRFLLWWQFESLYARFKYWLLPCEICGKRVTKQSNICPDCADELHRAASVDKGGE